jgi:hypothetical protein
MDKILLMQIYIYVHETRVQPFKGQSIQKLEKSRILDSATKWDYTPIKEDLKIIKKPIVYNKGRADILAQIAAIALLMKRAFAFIVKISMLFANYRSSNDPAIAMKLQPHYVPKCILSNSERVTFFFF